MGRIIHESLCSKVRYRFLEKGHLLFDNTDEIASAHAKGADINAVTASETKIGTMHPGASQYYNSAGEEPAEDDFEPEVVPEPETSSEPEETGNE